MLEIRRILGHNSKCWENKVNVRKTPMKKLTAMILTALLLLSLCACNGGKRATTGSDLTWEEVERIADRELADEGKNVE